MNLPPSNSSSRHTLRRWAIAGIACLWPILVNEPAQAQMPDRTHPPAPGPVPVFHSNPIEHYRLSNGIEVLLYQKHGIPLVQVNAIVRTGIVDEPSDKPGLATMTAGLMMEGAGDRDAIGVHNAVDYLGADLSVDAGYHTFGIALNTPVGKLDSALALMADVILRPRFPMAELDRKKKETLTALLEWRDDPRTLAAVLFNKVLYAATPYGRMNIGTAEGIGSFTVDDLKAFHAKYFGANRATIVVAGDVTSSLMIPKLEHEFGGWKPADAPAAPAFPVTQVPSTRVYLVDKPGAEQSEIIIGRVAASRMTDEFSALVVLNTILGGSFSSRLNHNLRETHGYTYGAGSAFDFRVEPGPFRASSSVQTRVTDSSLIEFMKELRAIREPVPESELKKARQYVALSYPAGFQTVGEIAGEMDNMVVFHLPDDYFNTYIGQILSVSEDQVRAAATKYIDPEKLAIVIVGDLSKIRESIEKLHMGPESVGDDRRHPREGPGCRQMKVSSGPVTYQGQGNECRA